MSITIRCGRAPAFQAFARARARASRSAPSSVGSAAIAAITRKAVASDATGPNSGSCSRTARRSARQSPPSASITARSRTTRPRSCPPRRSRILARPSDNAAVRPSLSAASANSPAPACDTRPSPSDATSTVKRRPSRCTLKVILPSRGFDLRHAEESLLSRTVQRPRPPGPQLRHARSGLARPESRWAFCVSASPTTRSRARRARCGRPPRPMLRRRLTRASDWLLALAVLAAVLALMLPSHAVAQRSDLVLGALVLFTALGIAPAQLATLTAHKAQLAVLVGAPFVALVPLAWLISRLFSGAVRDGTLALGVASTEVAAVGLVALAGGSAVLALRALAGSLGGSGLLRAGLVGGVGGGAGGVPGGALRWWVSLGG